MSGVVDDNELRGMDENERMKLVDDRLYDMWQRRWDECESGRVTYKY